MKVAWIKTPLMAVMVAMLPLISEAQCKSFTRKKCLPLLSPFMHNGQLNSVVLAPGEKAELQMTFYSGQEYRLVVCGQEVLQGAFFTVLDKNDREVYNSKGETKRFWDFKVASTQRLTVVVEVPAKESAGTNIVETGCVAVLVGFKQ